MNNKIFIGLIVLAAGVLAGLFVFGGKLPTTMEKKLVVTPTPAGSNLGPPEEVTEGTGGTEKGGSVSRTVVTMTDRGFSPSPVTVKRGTVVTFVNESTTPMWVASDPHPAHTILPEFDQKKSAGKNGVYEYLFTSVGTWTYHNHENPAAKGVISVTQ